MYTGYYRFGSSSDTLVRCVHASCNDGNVCIFLSETNIELQVSTPNNPLHSSDKCTVNYVEIIHDCMPRSVDLTLKFTDTSYSEDNLYLQVNKDHKLTLALITTAHNFESQILFL